MFRNLRLGAARALPETSLPIENQSFDHPSMERSRSVKVPSPSVREFRDFEPSDKGWGSGLYGVDTAPPPRNIAHAPCSASLSKASELAGTPPPIVDPAHCLAALLLGDFPDQASLVGSERSSAFQCFRGPRSRSTAAGRVSSRPATHATTRRGRSARAKPFRQRGRRIRTEESVARSITARSSPFGTGLGEIFATAAFASGTDSRKLLTTLPLIA